MSSMMAQAHSILNALDEGYVMGVLEYIQNTHPSFTKKEVKRELCDFLSYIGWDSERIDYWFDWFKGWFK